MKAFALFFALALTSCASLPVDVFRISSGTSIEAMKSTVLRPPDRIAHFQRDGHSVEVWTYVSERISIVFQDNIIVEWRN